MTWQDRYREDKKAKLTVPVATQTYELFKKLCKEEKTGTTQMIRAMIKHVIAEYAEEVKDIK
jgi:hypothetical protein